MTRQEGLPVVQLKSNLLVKLTRKKKIRQEENHVYLNRLLNY